MADHPSQSSEKGDSVLCRTIDDLKTRIEAQRQALEKIRASLPITQSKDETLPSQLHDITSLKKAYTTATLSPPYLPLPISHLPFLLALRQTHNTIRNSHINVLDEKSSLSALQGRLESETAKLANVRLLQTSLAARTAILQTRLASKNAKSSTQFHDGILEKLRVKAQKYDEDTRSLTEALNAFLQSNLGKMLMLEEEGGSIVGSVCTSATKDAEATNAAQKRARVGEKDQRRIDEIWGNEQRQADDIEKEEERGKEQMVIEEFRMFVSRLMNCLVESGGGEGAWVEVSRESAATRFLVRSRVALIHPRRDKIMLRLVDFGKDFDG